MIDEEPNIPHSHSLELERARGRECWAWELGVHRWLGFGEADREGGMELGEPSRVTPYQQGVQWG